MSDNCIQPFLEVVVILTSNFVMKNERHWRHSQYSESIRARTIEREKAERRDK